MNPAPRHALGRPIERGRSSHMRLLRAAADGQSNLPAFCRVALTVSPQVNIAVWLPTQATYNGRFQAVGGGGYAGTISFGAMAGALRNGYATASTDTGHSAFVTPGGSFALIPDGTLNWQLIEDFASRSLIELTKKAKTLIAAFYGQPATGSSATARRSTMPELSFQLALIVVALADNKYFLAHRLAGGASARPRSKARWRAPRSRRRRRVTPVACTH